MKKIFRFLIIASLLAPTAVTMGQMNPGALLLDSVYGYNWVSNNWTLNTKNYRIKNETGQTIQSLYKKYDSGTGHYLDFVRFLYTYPDTLSMPSTTTDQFWYSNLWNTYQYTHFLTGDIIDTTYSKAWDNQQHRFTSGSRNTSQYDDSLLLLEKVNQAWDTTIQDWLNTSKTTYSYTALMQPSEQIILSWRISSASWVNIYRYSDIYDSNNVLVSHLEYTWNDSASVWVSAIRTTYYNNPASMPYLAVKERWDSTLLVWDSLSQSGYYYNPFNWLLTVLTQNYNPETGQWANGYLSTYTYSNFGDQQTMTGEVWDSIHLTWIPDKYQILDSASQKLAESFSRNVDPMTFLITGGIRNLYTYTPTGDTLNKVFQQWLVSGNDWANNTQVLYTYDSHNLLTEDLTQDWSSAGSSWVNDKKSDYFYSEFIGTGEHPAKVRPCFYSNPLVSGSSINCPDLRTGNEYTLRICAPTGIEVYRTVYRGGESVMIPESIASGLYVLILEEKNSILYKDKIVIIH